MLSRSDDGAAIVRLLFSSRLKKIVMKFNHANMILVPVLASIQLNLTPISLFNLIAANSYFA